MKNIILNFPAIWTTMQKSRHATIMEGVKFAQSFLVKF